METRRKPMKTARLSKDTAAMFRAETRAAVLAHGGNERDAARAARAVVKGLNAGEAFTTYQMRVLATLGASRHDAMALAFISPLDFSESFAMAALEAYRQGVQPVTFAHYVRKDGTVGFDNVTVTSTGLVRITLDRASVTLDRHGNVKAIKGTLSPFDRDEVVVTVAGLRDPSPTVDEWPALFGTAAREVALACGDTVEAANARAAQFSSPPPVF